jgi:ERCC4-related helicase
MDKKISDKYEELAKPIIDTLKRMNEKYKEKNLKTSDINQELSKVMGQLQKLKSFLNNPDDYISGIENPKISRAGDIIEERLQKDDNSKTVTFTDSPGLAEKSTKKLSERFPYKKHVVALAGKIEIYENGKVIESFSKTSKLIDPKTGQPVPSEE